MEENSKILVVGSRGMVGSAIVRRLKALGYSNVLEVGRDECDLINQEAVDEYFSRNKPEYVFVAAAKVGGIIANSTYPADFIYLNLMIECNVIHASFVNKVEKLLFLGSTCIYPKHAEQPLREEALLTGSLEPTNEAYALAKIAGLKMCDFYSQQYGCNFISAMPTNIYGYGDNFHPDNSHVIPGLIRRFHEGKVNRADKVVCWGSGKPLREFLFVDDLAEALVFMMSDFEGPGFANVGTGEEVTIKDAAEMIARVVGFTGEIQWDTSKPDGTMRKVTDMRKLHQLGWRHSTSLEEGLCKTYEWYVQRY